MDQLQRKHPEIFAGIGLWHAHLKAQVWSVATYGSEGWTLRGKEEKYIEAFEMWCYRRLLRILWTQHKTNDSISCKLKVDRELLDRVKSLKLGFYGHTTQKYESLEKEIVQGCVPGYRNRGRQRRRWTDDVAEWTGMKINEVATAADNRDHWRSILRAAYHSYGGRHWTTTMRN